MSGMKDILKKGWHPEKEGTTFKGQMKSLVGRGEKETHISHAARPLSSLKDPASFGPPPKHVTAGAILQPPRPEDLGHLKADSSWQASAGSPHASTSEAGERAPAPPYRANTTGLSTTHLPAPPVRGDGTGASATPPPSADVRPSPPKLPPRLPPRPGDASPFAASGRAIAEPPRREDLLNSGAVSRLSAAGVLVSGLGIGGNGNETGPSPQGTGSGTGTGSGESRLGRLQGNMSKLGITAGGSPQGSGMPTEGTTFAQKQAAFSTAAAFRKDPSSVSLADAKSAAATANNFRQRHGDQVAAGMRTASSLNERYGVADKLAKHGVGKGDGSAVDSGSVGKPLAGLKKKPPPPPPAKKPGLGAGSKPDTEEPPPVPMATRPTF